MGCFVRERVQQQLPSSRSCANVPQSLTCCACLLLSQRASRLGCVLCRTVMRCAFISWDASACSLSPTPDSQSRASSLLPERRTRPPHLASATWLFDVFTFERTTRHDCVTFIIFNVNKL